MSKNRLIISRPGLGQTQKAINFCLEKMCQNLNGVFVSLADDSGVIKQRFMDTFMRNNSKIIESNIKNLYIQDSLFSLRDVVDYVKSINDDIKFIVIDYLQLITHTNSDDLKKQLDEFFYFLNEFNIDVLILSQINKNVTEEMLDWNEITSFLIAEDKIFLDYIDDGCFLTNQYGEINLINIKD